MGLDEAEQIWNELVAFYGDNLAHPDHEPKRFAHQCKLYRYINNYGHKPSNTSQKENENGIQN